MTKFYFRRRIIHRKITKKRKLGGNLLQHAFYLFHHIFDLNINLCLVSLGLNSLVKGLLTNCDNVPEFDWLCFNDIGK